MNFKKCVGNLIKSIILNHTVSNNIHLLSIIHSSIFMYIGVYCKTNLQQLWRDCPSCRRRWRPGFRWPQSAQSTDTSCTLTTHILSIKYVDDGRIEWKIRFYRCVSTRTGLTHLTSLTSQIRHVTYAMNIVPYRRVFWTCLNTCLQVFNNPYSLEAERLLYVQ